MAVSVIKMQFVGKYYGSNITPSNIDSIKRTGIYQSYFAGDVPYSGAWGILIVLGDITIQQILINTKGIAVRHSEDKVTWGEWKKIALS